MRDVYVLSFHGQGDNDYYIVEKDVFDRAFPCSGPAGAVCYDNDLALDLISTDDNIICHHSDVIDLVNWALEHALTYKICDSAEGYWY